MEKSARLNSEVTRLLDELDHPLREIIEDLRLALLNANSKLSENIEWNGPNYLFEGEDRITMRIQPPKQIQLLFHCGAKVLEQPKKRLIDDAGGLLTWKTNDRAVATFIMKEDVEVKRPALTKVVKQWLAATTGNHSSS